jgi:hypothetical protein
VLRDLDNFTNIAVYSNFVPNLTMGAPIISCLRKHTDAFFGKLGPM